MHTTFKDNEAGRDLSIVVNQLVANFPTGSESDVQEMLRGALRDVLLEENVVRANKYAGKQLELESEVIEGVFTPSDRRAAAVEVASEALWNAAYGDQVLVFETEFQRSKLVDFLVSYPSFLKNAAISGDIVSLETIPALLRKWSESGTVAISDDQIEFLKGVCFFSSCRFGRALEILEPLARRTTDAGTVATAAEAALHVGQYSVALKHFERALSIERNEDSGTQLRKALWLSNVGACHEELLDCEQALPYYYRALAMVSNSRKSSISSLIRALILNNIGFSLMTLGDESDEGTNLAEAQVCFEEALKLREDEEDIVPNLAVVYFNLAEVRRKQGDVAEASFNLDRAKGTLRRLDRPHILMASIHNAEGKAHFDRRDYTKALVCFHEARAILSQHFGEISMKSVLTTYSIATTLEAMGDPDASNYLLHAKRLAMKSIDDPRHPLKLMIEEDLASSPSRSNFNMFRRIFGGLQ